MNEIEKGRDRALSSRRRAALRIAVAACAAAAGSTAYAQSYPRSPIHLIVPYTPGGATDLIGRQLGAEMTKRRAII